MGDPSALYVPTNVRRTSACEDFRQVFDPAICYIFNDRMEQNQDLFAKLMTDQDLAALVTRNLRKDVDDRILDVGG